MSPFENRCASKKSCTDEIETEIDTNEIQLGVTVSQYMRSIIELTSATQKRKHEELEQLRWQVLMFRAGLTVAQVDDALKNAEILK